jgi:hypothetical protein
MTQSQIILTTIYGLFVHRDGKRLPIVERYLGILVPPTVSVDDRRNERATYEELAGKYRDTLDDLLRHLLREMQMVSYEQSAELLDGAEFLQLVVSSTLWRYHFHLNDLLEQFARDFDRLDIPDERFRLYQFARNKR